MATVNVELNNKASKDGRHSVLLRLTNNRKSSRLNSGISVFKKDFNSGAKAMKWIRVSEPYYNQYNNALKTVFKDLELFATKAISKNPLLNSSEILEAFKMRNVVPKSNWLEFFDTVINSYAARNKVRYSMRIKAVRNKLEQYIGDDVSFDLNQTNLKWIKGFEEYLYALKNSVNTVSGNLKVVKQVYRNAIEEGLVPKPDLKVLSYSIKLQPVERDKLTEEEVQAFETCELDNASLEHDRDFFMFSYYCAGMRFSDCATLTWKQIDGDYLKYRMNKNAKLQVLKIPKPAIEILNNRSIPSKRKQENFVFELLDERFLSKTEWEQIGLLNTANVLLNKNLKVIARKAKINKRVSMHTARHSFAYNAFKKTKDVLAVKQVLQHSKLKETQDYITSLTNDQDRDILGEIFG